MRLMFINCQNSKLRRKKSHGQVIHYTFARITPRVTPIMQYWALAEKPAISIIYNNTLCI